MGLPGCSAQKDTFMARNWHNLLAHYNSYFIAREKIREVELGAQAGIKDNYNKPLLVFPPPGSASGQTALLDETVKKASIPIQRHKNSDWVDDSYLLIGKARFYQDDYENAVHTFKWVNAKGKDPAAKQEALVWLARTYTDMKEYSFATSAITALQERKLTKANEREYYLTAANFYHRQREWDMVLGNVEAALPLMPKRPRRGRMEFLAGQLRQARGEDQEAFAHFREVLRCKPNYELSFNAKLSMAQVTNPGDEKGVKRIGKYFRKLLKDEKNKEYRDKIYYELGRWELKQDQVDKAIASENKSLRSNGSTTGLKGYVYWELGKIYYERMKRFDVAKVYYDSAIAAIDTADENYKPILRRQKILAEFLKEYETIQREDSLRRLANMDSTQLTALIDKMATDKKVREEEAAKKAEREARKAERAAGGGGGDDPFSSAFASTSSTDDGGAGAAPTPGGAPQWYFYNPALVARGKTTFQRKWGRRVLEDNWRRKKKDANQTGDEPEVAGNENPSAGGKSPTESLPDSLQGQGAKQPEGKYGVAKRGEGKKEGGKGEEGKPGEDAVLEKPADDRAAMMNDVPRTAEAKQQSDERLRLALFNIGKIYDQKLEEPVNAEQSFRRVALEFPEYEKVPESLYNLWLIYGRPSSKDRAQQPAKADSVKQVLLTRFPNSMYAKLIENPNYLVESRQATEAAKLIYKNAYYSYKDSKYIAASKLVASIRREYPENTFTDRVDLLAAMIAGKTLDISTYQDSLKAFKSRHPKSDLVKTADQMIEIAQKKGGTGDSAGSAAIAPAAEPGKVAPVTWTTDIDGPQVYVSLIPMDKMTEDDARKRFSDFNKLLFPQENLTVNTLIFNDKLFMVTVRELRSKAVAGFYLKKQESLDGAIDDLMNEFPHVHLILSKENYPLLYKSKNVESYKEFYKRAYPK